jgi:hypothetical protein
VLTSPPVSESIRSVNVLRVLPWNVVLTRWFTVLSIALKGLDWITGDPRDLWELLEVTLGFG